MDWRHSIDFLRANAGNLVHFDSGSSQIFNLDSETTHQLLFYAIVESIDMI